MAARGKTSLSSHVRKGPCPGRLRRVAVPFMMVRFRGTRLRCCLRAAGWCAPPGEPSLLVEGGRAVAMGEENLAQGFACESEGVRAIISAWDRGPRRAYTTAKQLSACGVAGCCRASTLRTRPGGR